MFDFIKSIDNRFVYVDKDSLHTEHNIGHLKILLLQFEWFIYLNESMMVNGTNFYVGDVIIKYHDKFSFTSNIRTKWKIDNEYKYIDEFEYVVNHIKRKLKLERVLKK
jgi:hypothetical protein